MSDTVIVIKKVDEVCDNLRPAPEEAAKLRPRVRCLRTFQSYERTNVAPEKKLGSEGLHCDTA